MVLETAFTFSKRVLPPQYYPHAAISGLALLVTYAFAQGRTTTRDRDLHARTVLVTGAFTPLGLTLVTALASRGAHVIAISPYPLEHSQPTLLIPLLRSTTKNENIYAEYADLCSPESIRAFCTKFLTEGDQRLDAIVFGHEYHGIGSLFDSKVSREQQRDAASLASFLIVTLLLPVLLVAPVERDIRIVTIINPFYAAALPSFSNTLASAFATTESQQTTKPESVFLAEGRRALRTAVLTRHLQRVLDALPNRGPSLDGSSNSKDAPNAHAPPTKPRHSNIISVSVSPGISRADTMAPLLHADRESTWSLRGFLIYFLLYPLLWLFTKSPIAALQSVLHALFLPTPFKRALAQVSAATDPSSSSESNKQGDIDDRLPEEVLKPGALYRECSVVTLGVPPLPSKFIEAMEDAERKRKEKAGKKGKMEEDAFPLEDDGEFGGEMVGRTVWEWYEMKLKEWEAREKANKAVEKESKDTAQLAESSKPSTTS
ncbi:unnamed protein product [Somion occarium]|uniref:Ketoreductase (KR) domain-containing protein n=1 Tax=Somion occarium TaxID=3059160 RepID=A0ABP1DV72_9APHY